MNTASAESRRETGAMEPFFSAQLCAEGFLFMYTHFEDMTKKLSPTLRRIAHRMNGHFTFFSDEDLYQEALIHLWLLFSNGELGDKTDSYILQGCYFHLKNYLRSALDKVRPASLDEAIDDGETTLAETLAINGSGGYDKIDEVLLDETLASKGLTERESEVVCLLKSGLTVREIGVRLGVSHVMIVKIRARIQKKCAELKNISAAGYQS